MRSLDKRTLRYRSRNDGKDTYPTIKRKSKHKSTVRTFANMYESEDQKLWRVFIYDDSLEKLTPEAKNELRAWGYNKKKPKDFWMGAECHSHPNEWLLSVDTKNGVYWSCADFTVPVKRNDKEFYDRRWPYFSVQIRPKRKGEPFKVDGMFIRAIKRLLTEAEVKSYEEGLKFAPNGLLRKRDLKRLYEFYREEGGGK